MDSQKPFLLKITFDDIADEQKYQIHLLLTSLFITLLLLNIYLLLVIFSKVYNYVINTYNLINVYLDRNKQDTLI